MNIEHLISQYGYAVLIIGTFFEGETILIAAGFSAHSGHLSLPWVIAAAFLGGLGGDQFYFYLGRVKGREFLRRRPFWESKVSRVLELIDRYKAPLVLGFRFMYGFRTVTPFTIGLSGMNRGSFLTLNVFGVALWATLVALVGYFFGVTAAAVITGAKKYHWWIMLGIVCTGAVLWTIRLLWRPKKNPEQKEIPKGTDA